MTKTSSQESPDSLFTKAVALFQSGNLSEAEAITQTLLAAYPENAYVLNLLGIIAEQKGNLRQGKQLLEKAIAINPSYGEAYNNYGFVLYKLKEYKTALSNYDQAIAINPGFIEAYKNRALIFYDLAQHNDALENYSKVIALSSDNAGAYNSYGIVLYKLKRYGEALESYNKAIAINPHYAEAHQNRGVALSELKRYDEALASCDKAITLDPACVMAYSSRGIALNALKRYDEALASYDKAIAINPCCVEAYNNRGLTLFALKRYDEALENHDKAITIAPDSDAAYINRGNTLSVMRRYSEALENYDKAIAINPDSDVAYTSRGNTLSVLRRYSEALESHDKAIAIKLKLPAPEHDNGLAIAYYNKSSLKLLMGEFEEGWKLHEWRWKKDGTDRKFKQPLWLGKEPLAGKTILLHAEQGLGDTIQFCRYVPMVNALGATVILEVQPSLTGLFSAFTLPVRIVARGEPLPDFDFYCPLMSLPLAFETTLNTIPASIPYFFVDPDKRKLWQERLGIKGKPRIGLVWSGATGHLNDHNRSIALGFLTPLLGYDFDFYSLQKEVRPNDEGVLANNKITSFANDLKDFTDTAALIMEMDIVISVDTSVAHLAGALGKPVWVLLPFATDFRWLLDREDSPWYPTARLFRQQKMGDWESVIEKVKRELAVYSGNAE